MARASETTVALWIVPRLCVCLCVVMFSLVAFSLFHPFDRFFVAAFAGRTRSCRVLQSRRRFEREHDRWLSAIFAIVFRTRLYEKSIGPQNTICDTAGANLERKVKNLKETTHLELRFALSTVR